MVSPGVVVVGTSFAIASGVFGLEQGAIERVQTIELKKGWNAVYLEVEPANGDPSAVFADLPVSVAATWFGNETPLEYISDPESKPWKTEGWGIWYADSRPDAFLKTLHTVHGAKSYLLFADENHTWNLSGKVIYQRLAWKSDSFNLVGFGLDPLSPPTFEKFFSGSRAHRQHRIYRLVDGAWKLVTTPAATTMRAGEAVWVYSAGASDYQGPVSAIPSFHQGLVFSSRSGWSGVRIDNRMPDPVDVEISVSQGGSSGPGVPLAYVALAKDESRNSVGRVSVPFLDKVQLSTLEPGSAVNFSLEIREAMMTAPTQAGYLTITSDLGTRIWIPVVGVREDLLDAGR